MRVSFLYFGQVPQLNGAAVFFKSLIDKKKVFEEQLGKPVNFFCQRTPTVNNALTNKATNKKKIILKTILNVLLPKTFIGSVLHFYIFLQRNAKKVVKQYLNDKQRCKDEIIIFNDIFVGIECVKNKQINLSKSILILHNDGNPLQMIIEGLPKLKNYKRLRQDVNNLITSVSKVILLSEKAKDNFLKNFPNLINKASVINNGVELQDVFSENPFKISHDRLFGITVGTISYRKGHDLLIKALKELPSEDKKKLTIFCLGNNEGDIDLSDTPENLVFLNGISHDLLSPYLKNVDFFLLCSRDEGLPLSILEAMQYGLPIFSTNVGGIPDVVDSNGVLFNPSINDIKNILKNIINEKYMLKEFAKQSRKLYEEKFSLDIMINKYILVIKEVDYE